MTPSQPCPGQTSSLLLVTNTHVGKDYMSWEGVKGKHGMDKCNSNSLFLLESCAAYGLPITNTVFHLLKCNKTSWMHLCSKHWHLLDYIFIRQRDRCDVRVMRTMCAAECWTDHHLLIPKMNLHIISPRWRHRCRYPLLH